MEQILKSDCIEMFDIETRCEAKRTRVFVGTGIRKRIGEPLSVVWESRKPERVLLVTDEKVGGLYSEEIIGAMKSGACNVFLHVVAVGESSKCVGLAEQLYHCLAENRFGRDDVVFALGGGVVSDLAGFVAATWMRGIRWVVVPTTIEAGVDACLGGKTAINIPGGKNLVGAFHPPIAVLADPEFFKTLNVRDVRAGLAESVKHAFLTSEEFVRWHEENVEGILGLDEQVLPELVTRNLKIKGGIVEADPFERTGRRMILNFGHTIGHAIEVCSGFTLRHGECVAMGMVAAGRISERLGLIEATLAERLEGLLNRFELPTRIPNTLTVDDILAALRLDKKVRDGRVQFVLLEGIGRPVIRGNVAESAVVDVVESLRN